MRYILFFLIGIFITACSSADEEKDPFSLVRFLRNDAPNVLHIGDTVGVMYSYNSCCKFCWMDSGQLLSSLPESSLLKVISTRELQAEPDCAGCSDVFYVYYRAERPGVDTLANLSVPMGMLGSMEGSCEELTSDSFLLKRTEWRDYLHVYPVRVE